MQYVPKFHESVQLDTPGIEGHVFSITIKKCNFAPKGVAALLPPLLVETYAVFYLENSRVIFMNYISHW